MRLGPYFAFGVLRWVTNTHMKSVANTCGQGSGNLQAVWGLHHYCLKLEARCDGGFSASSNTFYW